MGLYRLRDLSVLEFLGSALLSAAIGVQLVESAGLAVPVPVPATYVAGNLAGGIVFGIGMALSLVVVLVVEILSLILYVVERGRTRGEAGRGSPV